MTDDLVALAEQDGIQKLVVGAYILQDEKLLLLQRRSYEDFLPDLVELPSGGVDKGEVLPEALAREVMEETGLRIAVIRKYINFFDYVSGSGKNARQYNFLVEIEKPYTVKLNPAEHVEYFWVDPVEETLNNHFNLSDKTKAVILDAAAQFPKGKELI